MVDISICFLQDYKQSEETFSSTPATGLSLWATNFQHIKDRMQDGGLNVQNHF